MARAGLGAGWECLFANDFDPMKASTYAANWGDDHLLCEDVAKIDPSKLPGVADLAWASFPCQDLSLAGSYRGLGNAASLVMTRSGTFWPFWELMRALNLRRRAPSIIVLENVVGALTSRGGADFSAICRALSGANYRFGAVVIDARLFVPQSRQRVFFVAVAREVGVPLSLVSDTPLDAWHSPALIAAHNRLGAAEVSRWLWWKLPEPAVRKTVFADLIEDQPDGCRWHTAQETERLLSLMSPLNVAKVERARQAARRQVGAVYKRTRLEGGKKRLRAEVRFDDLAGCLRTPSGGSSRQTILLVEGGSTRSRLLSPREAARLMGLDENYRMPPRYNDAYHVAGDGVCVPVVRHLAQNLLEPILDFNISGDTLVAAE